MYEDFKATDRWTGEKLHCQWKGTIVAIATRQCRCNRYPFFGERWPRLDLLPNLAWVEQKRRTGYVITDYLAAQIAGRYLKQAIESGYDNGREMYSMTVDEVLGARRRGCSGGRSHQQPAQPAGDQREYPRRG